MIEKLKSRLEKLSIMALNHAEELRVAQAKVEAMDREDTALRGRTDELRSVIALLEKDIATDG